MSASFPVLLAVNLFRAHTNVGCCRVNYVTACDNRLIPRFSRVLLVSQIRGVSQE
jgi:hypothetical protein